MSKPKRQALSCSSDIAMPAPAGHVSGRFFEASGAAACSNVLYARTNIDSDRDQVKKLEIGYSDEVSVFLNGKILYRGRSAQASAIPASSASLTRRMTPSIFS